MFMRSTTEGVIVWLQMLGIADVTWDDVFDLGRAVGKKRSAFVSTVQTDGYDIIFNFEYPVGECMYVSCMAVPMSCL